MLASFSMCLCTVVVTAVSLINILATGFFVKNKEWTCAVVSGLTSILMSILSGSMLVGVYLFYIIEHLPK